MIPPILLIGIAGAAAAFFLSNEHDANAAPEGGGGLPSKRKPTPKSVPKPKGPKQPPKPASTLPPASVIGRIAAATASGNADTMRAEAAQLRHEGWTEQADSLEAAAATLDRVTAVPVLPPTTVANRQPGRTPPAAGGLPSRGLPPVPSVTVSLPDVAALPTGSLPTVTASKPKAPKPPKPAALPTSLAGAPLAIELQRHLTTHPVWKEDRELVKKFQAQEGLTPDGLYGVKVAKAATRYDLVPVKPYYWPTAEPGRKQAKDAWRAYAIDKAKQDPSRSEEWRGVA